MHRQSFEHTPRAMSNTNLLQPLNVLDPLTVYCTLLTSGLPWNMRARAVLAMHVALVAVSHQLKQFTLNPVWGNEGFSPTPVMMASCVHARVQCKRRSHTRTSGCEAQGCRGVLAGQADPSPGCLKITRQGEIAECCGARMSAKACTSASPAAFVMAPSWSAAYAMHTLCTHCALQVPSDQTLAWANSRRVRDRCRNSFHAQL